MAPARRFRLQQVLDYKQQVELLRERELATLAHQRRTAEEALWLLEQQATEQLDALAERTARGRIVPAELQQTLGYLESVRQVIAGQRDLAAELEERVRASRDSLVDAARERQVLERLRERHAAAEAVDAERREQSAADELTAQRFGRYAWEV